MGIKNEPLIDEVEWTAQEQGVYAARKGDASKTDGISVRYRVIADALISVPHTEPPADFVAEVMAHIAREKKSLDVVLLRILQIVFALAVLVMGTLYGGEWWQSLNAAMTANVTSWLLLGAVCAALSWGFRHWLEHGDWRVT